MNSTCLNLRCKVLNLSSFRRIYFEGFIASFVNQAKTVMASVHIINVLNLPSNAFNTIRMICASSKISINSFLGIYHVSVCCSTILLLASLKDRQFSFTKYAAAVIALDFFVARDSASVVGSHCSTMAPWTWDEEFSVAIKREDGARIS